MYERKLRKWDRLSSRCDVARHAERRESARCVLKHTTQIIRYKRRLVFLDHAPSSSLAVVVVVNGGIVVVVKKSNVVAASTSAFHDATLSITTHLLTHTRASVRIYTRARSARERERERGRRGKTSANIWRRSGCAEAI